MTTCQATKTVAGVTFRCTEPHGHKGQHKARGLDAVVLRRWARTPSRARALKAVSS